MSFASFLSALFEDGRPRVPSYAPVDESEARAADRVLADFERLYRLEMPGTPPPFDPDAGRWSAMLFLRGCQLAVYRDLPPELIAGELAVPCPCRRGPLTDYSADLVFRFIPDLLTLARGASEKDPLVPRLRELAREWPLYSVGVADLGPVVIDSFADNPSLMALYADRVLAKGDAGRMNDPRLRQAVEAAVGMHRELAGKLAPLLETPA
jgi:hypothetical protein